MPTAREVGRIQNQWDMAWYVMRGSSLAARQRAPVSGKPPNPRLS